MTAAVVVGASIGLGANALVVLGAYGYVAVKRRLLIRRTLRAFDAEFPA